MKIITKTANENGGHPPIQEFDAEHISDGYAEVPTDLDVGAFYKYNGFVTLELEGDTVVSMSPNVTAWENWHAIQPNPDIALADEVRAKRDKLLTATDWTQTLDAPISPASREAMRVYRQALRDITEQEGFPATAVFPVEPVMEKAVPDPIDNAVDIMIGGEGNA